MPDINVVFDSAGILEGVSHDDIVHIHDASWILAVLEGGMVSGKPSLGLMLPLPDGKVLVAETSLEVWCAAAKVLRARYPEET